jgi:hypothetical protein
VAKKQKQKRSVKKRPAKKKTVIATRRSTAGTGFDFEDCVAAWLVLQALAGRALPVHGHPQRLQMQTGSLLWDIDDILFTARGQAGDERLAVSCKGNVQVSANGLPQSFAEQAWRLWNKADSPFNRATDVMTLATQGTNAGFQGAWSDIKTIASGADPALATAQIAANPRYKRIVDALKSAAGVIPGDADVLSLIRRVEVLPFDFQQAQSKDVREAIALARSLLVGGVTQRDAKRLWDDIVSRARETRLGSGTLDMAALRRWLRRQFTLKDLPDYELSWSRLRALSAETESVIQTCLPSSAGIDLRSDCNSLFTELDVRSCLAVYGESGTGKSALVKVFLETHFPTAASVWLAPEHLEQALNEAERAHFGIAHPLIRVLDAAATPENFLIIDAAERLTPPARVRAQQLITQLLALNGTGRPPPWRVIIVGQTEFWASGELQRIIGGLSSPRWEVGLRSTGEVASALRASRGLEWLASHHDALLALTNLRTLAWVVQAAAVFQDGSAALPASLVAIAEKLWFHWTQDRTALQGFLMRLAARDAAFEHSVPISSLEPADAKAFDERPQQCPVRRNLATNHVQFEHDLAADWARFQQLKEVAADTARWATYAENPLWNGALRMLGQFLLRQPSGTRTAWDDAFDTVQASQGSLPLADDILLDALFLDPEAIAFLEQRADMLFANNARHLQRLLARFEHVATVSGVADGPLKDFGIHLEAFRTPIVGRWPALAAFLNRHRERVADLVLSRVSLLCERWLTTMPLAQRNGTPFPYRREFAELALATARARQLSEAKGDIYIGDDTSIFQAAFAGAQDIPDEVEDWALEMARRRAMRGDLAEKLRAYEQERAAEHRRRLDNDAEYRERHARKRNIASFPSGRRLPPWPLGPKGRVDNRFAEAVLRSATFQRLMRARPAATLEVLLAVLIEDAPEESFSSHGSYREELGLAPNHEGYPTAYWKSPLFSFLHIDSPMALDTLLKLQSFCTDRWEHEVARHQGSAPSPLSVRLSDGTQRLFRGRYNTFAWSQANDHVNGQLYSALAALEKWLSGLADQGADITGSVGYLMRHSDSVAVLGVLINVGKRLPELFRTELKPLLAVAEFYVWDEGRVRNSDYSFDGQTWVRSGTLIFELARDWYAAPYRHKNLIAIVSELCRQDHALGDFVNAAAGRWAVPEDDKERIEFQSRAAQLDYRNYRVSRAAETGEEQSEFVYPDNLTAAITRFQQSNRRAREILAFPDNCRRFVATPATLPEQQITAIADLMAAADREESVELDEEMVRPARVAAAVVLLLGAREWLAANSEVRDRAQAIIGAAIDDTSLEKDRSHFRYAVAPSYLEFVAYFVFHEWLSTLSAATDHQMMRILTCGDDRAAGVIAGMAYVHRTELGDRWWRLLYLALLWSGLTILKPRFRHEGEADQRRWLRRAHWLLARRVSEQRCAVDDIRPLDVAERIEEFEARQREEEYRREGRRFTRDRSRRTSGALDTHFLEITFAWLVTDQDLPTDAAEREQRRRLLTAFWAHQSWWLVGSESESTRDYAPMGQFGYKLLDAIAAIILVTDVSAASALWQPVFDIGPKGHYAIGHFFLAFFNNLKETTDTFAFAACWRPMIEAVLEGRGWESGPWYHQQSLERQALGFANADALVRPTEGPPLVESVRDLYRTWAERRLPGDEDNLAAFCNFLSTRTGASLRLEGLGWVANALRADAGRRDWYRDGTSAAFVEFLSTIITEDGAAAVATPETRQALIDLTGLAVSRQLSVALAIQDRLTQLL